MTDATVETPMPSAGTRGWLGLAGWEIAAGLVTLLVLALLAATRTNVTNLIACALGAGFTAALFLWSPPGTTERAIHLVPRYVRFLRDFVGGSIDVHTRVVEGRHYTDRVLPADIPLSPHFGAMWLSHFDHHGLPAALLIEGGTRLRPWRAAHMVVVQVSGQDQLLLESANHQEAIRQRWNTMLDTQLKRNLGLTGIQELLLHRPMRQGEGAHWERFTRLLDHQPVPELRRRYESVQVIHDATTIDRRIFLVLRSGGTLSSWFKARRRGSARAGVEEHFGSVLDKLPNVARQAHLNVIGTLTADKLAAELRLMVDPASAPAVGYRRDGDREVRTVPNMVAPITNWDVHRDHLVVNGRYVATYRTVGWPDVVLGSSLLASALSDYPSSLRVAIPIGPEDPRVAKRINKAGMTDALSKADRKREKGSVMTEEERMAGERPTQRDVEQARGKHHPARYTAYFTIDADDADGLRRAFDELTTRLDTVGVDIMNCYGLQAEAVGFTFPFCWGV